MHQTKKGNEWHFGLEAHVGVDSKTKVIHLRRYRPSLDDSRQRLPVQRNRHRHGL
jgi:hypothetical protein